MLITFFRRLWHGMCAAVHRRDRRARRGEFWVRRMTKSDLSAKARRATAEGERVPLGVGGGISHLTKKQCLTTGDGGTGGRKCKMQSAECRMDGKRQARGPASGFVPACRNYAVTSRRESRRDFAVASRRKSRMGGRKWSKVQCCSLKAPATSLPLKRVPRTPRFYGAERRPCFESKRRCLRAMSWDASAPCLALARICGPTFCFLVTSPSLSNLERCWVDSILA